ncbi:MAG: cyclic nucleotide-gated ion channel [Sphingomonadales bacterium]|jgi:voltage-gated potassium channel
MAGGGDNLSPLWRIRRRTHEILETGPEDDVVARLVDGVLLFLILANLVAVALETLPSLAQFEYYFHAFEIFSVAIFTIEYVLRLWASVERPGASFYNAITARLRYMATPLAIFDLLAILPFYIGVSVGVDLRALRIFRVVRILKLIRYSVAMATLGRVLRNEIRALTAALIIMMGLVFVAATLLYYVERHVQPEAFQSIPHAMWWSVATLTTVGYGDVVPITPVGRILASVIMVFGLGVYAIPIGIMASGFSSEIHRQSFIVRLEMLARVPLFKDLGASALNELSRLLHTQKYAAGEFICVAGDRAISLTIIAAGKAEAHIADRTVTLHPGDYFGELALIRGGRHQITVIAGQNCRVMKMEVGQFIRLAAREPDIAAVVGEAMGDRLVTLTEAGEISREEAERALARWRLLTRQ